jgi:uncharacterized protein (DUF1697 family)
MPVYVSLLRGINLGGHKKIKMDQLRTSFEALGFEQVKTYIQSGNVVFKAPNTSPDGLCKKIETKIQGDFGHSVSVIVRTANEIKQVMSNNPFVKVNGIDPEKLHVMFLSKAPETRALEKVILLASAPQRLRCVGRELHLYLPHGVAESFVMRKPVDRLLAVVTTMRNWRTVNAIHQMCLDCH